VPTAPLSGTLTAAKWATPTAFPVSLRAFGTILRATRSDAENGVGKSKAPPSRRFKSVRRHSQERFARLSRSLRPGSHRDDLAGRNEPGRQNTNPARLSFRPATGETIGSKSSLCMCHRRGRTEKGKCTSCQTQSVRIPAPACRRLGGLSCGALGERARDGRDQPGVENCVNTAGALCSPDKSDPDDRYSSSSTTGLRNIPSSGEEISTISPALSQRGGSARGPSLTGVPVTMTSAGLIVMNVVM
jgi:hypothetical protein